MDNNGYISYLNSLHSLSAGGANSLAESQALNEYFTELYEPFEIVQPLIDYLREGSKVVILTGHAGDGKSTVALDIYKQLENLDQNAPLDSPLKDLEIIGHAKVAIVKDMSELSIQKRQSWLTKAFEVDNDSSWLIVSNTGPLLQGLDAYAKSISSYSNIESDILEALSKPVKPHALNLKNHSLSGLSKELVILNLTRLDNVRLGSSILNKMVNHSAWKKCSECAESNQCPIRQNRSALKAAGQVPEERVRWVYQRLNAYEHRLTLRQIVAHLALSITSGMSCEEAKHLATSDPSTVANPALEHTLFSEAFFGYKNGKEWPESQRLHAIYLLNREAFGSPAGVEFDRIIATEKGMGWADIPTELDTIDASWRQRSKEGAALRWRYALRRMNYIFGKVKTSHESQARLFFNVFLISEMLIDFDNWQIENKLTLSGREVRALENACLTVLMEAFSGFSAGQFEDHDKIHLTLRRSDKSIVQPTQIVTKSLPFRDFRLNYCNENSAPILSYLGKKATLRLSLPLLDYIKQRNLGEIGSSLSPIYQAQLDSFQGKLIREGESSGYDDEIKLLQTGVSGKVKLDTFFLSEDSDKIILEG